MKKITIKEIAKKAGVSVGTVDRVLHNRGEVAQATKELVIKIAEEGNYSTNVFARTLKLNKTFEIAVILPQDNEYWRTQRSGIEKAAAEYESLGLNVKLYKFDRHDQKSFLAQAHEAIAAGPDGVVIAPLLDEAREICAIMDQQLIPYVFVDSNLDGTHPLSFVGQDTFQSGYLAAKLLNYGKEAGCPAQILKYSDYDIWNKTVTERINGFKKYYQDKSWNLDLISEFEISESDGFSTHLDQITHLEVLRIFVPNSRAFQVVDLLKSNGISAIHRMVGYDLTSQNLSELQNGQIDFILNQNPSQQGYLSVQALYKRLIVNTQVSKIQYMPVEIVTKENCQYSNISYL